MQKPGVDRWWEATCRVIKGLKNRKNPNALIFMCMGIAEWAKGEPESTDLLPQSPQDCPQAVCALIAVFEELREWNGQTSILDPFDESVSDQLGTIIERGLQHMHVILQQSL